VADLDLQALASSPRRGNPISRLLRNQALARGLRPGDDAIEVYCFRMRDLWGASLNALDRLLASTATDSTQGGERVRHENLPGGAVEVQASAPLAPPPSKDLAAEESLAAIISGDRSETSRSEAEARQKQEEPN